MADSVSAAPASPKKTKSSKPRPKPSHPKTSEMVLEAIKSLKERGGSSLQAIKKYIAANYKVDVEKLSPFLKKYLKSAVTGGTLIQTKGKGASGSFKLSASALKDKEIKKPKTPKKKKAATSKPKKPSAKKTVKKAPAKKPAAAAKKPAPKKATKKTPSKQKKAKSPKKPKAPKPKKAAKPKSKKTAASKKK